MNNEPLISIVMPVYNSAKFLSRSIESVLAQTYKNIEVVLLDDDSTDNSWDIIQEYQKKDSRIKAYKIPFVEGPKVARDNAIRRASAEWIIAIDSDDTIESEYVEKVWNRHLETNADFIGTKMVLVDEVGNSLGGTIPSSDFNFSVEYSGTEAMLRTLSEWQFGANGALWKLSVMNNICPESTHYGYEDEYDTRVYLNNCDRVAFVDADYYFTQNTHSCTHKITFNSLTYILFNKVKLKQYFDKTYGRGCALALFYENCTSEEYTSIIHKLIKYKISNRENISEEKLSLLTDAYSIFREHNIHNNYFKVQYYRILWFILRKLR